MDGRARAWRLSRGGGGGEGTGGVGWGGEEGICKYNRYFIGLQQI